MQRYHRYYILRDVDKNTYIVDNEEYGINCTWDVWKATRFTDLRDAMDWANKCEYEGYSVEILIAAMTLTEVKGYENI